MPEPVTEISEMAPTTPAPATPAPATPAKRMEMKLPVEEWVFTQNWTPFLLLGDVFCLHKGWVDMFQFLMSWCCLGFKFANTLWKCWTWVQPWSLKDVGLCISSVLLYRFTVYTIRWNFQVVMFGMQPLPPRVQTVAGRGYILLIVEIWWSLKISKLPHDLIGQPQLTC